MRTTRTAAAAGLLGEDERDLLAQAHLLFDVVDPWLAVFLGRASAELGADSPAATATDTPST